MMAEGVRRQGGERDIIISTETAGTVTCTVSDSVDNRNSCDFTIFACYCDFTLCYPAGFCLPGSGVDGAPLSPELHDLLTGLLEPDPKLRSVLLIATLWDRNKMSKHYFSDKVIPLFQRFSLVLHF